MSGLEVCLQSMVRGVSVLKCGREFGMPLFIFSVNKMILVLGEEHLQNVAELEVKGHIFQHRAALSEFISFTSWLLNTFLQHCMLGISIGYV